MPNVKLDVDEVSVEIMAKSLSLTRFKKLLKFDRDIRAVFKLLSLQIQKTSRLKNLNQIVPGKTFSIKYLHLGRRK